MKGNTSKFIPLVITVVMGVWAGAAARADIINFETNPSEPTGPSLFVDAGPAQTIAVDGVTFTGGVILGDEANVVVPYVTPPNVYATSDFGDPSLQEVMDIALNPSVDATSVEGLLLNGETVPVTYTVDDYNGATLLGSQVFTDLDTVQNAGSEQFTITSSGDPITLVTFSPDTSATDGAWDYSIDTIAINESIQDAVVPEPQTYAELALGLAVLAYWQRRRKQGASAAL